MDNARTNDSQIVFSTLDRGVEVVEMQADSRYDLFQIGRLQDEKIDFAVDQINNQDGISNVSRFACRIQVNRETGEARIYGAGFDRSNQIFLGEHAKQWRLRNGKVDGLTTNGVWVCFNPENPPRGLSQLERWREISVTGEVYPCLRDRAVHRDQVIDNGSNVLLDFSIIDLAGVTMVWRTRAGNFGIPKTLLPKLFICFC